MSYKRKERKGFLILHRNRVQLEFLTDEQRGQLLMALLNFSEHWDNPGFDGILGMAFATMAEQITHDAEAWNDKCEKNRNNRIGNDQNEYEQTLTTVNRCQPSSTTVNGGDQSNPNPNPNPNQSQKGDGRGQADEQFSGFWSAYPKKQGKKDARRAFEKAIRHTSLGTILSALERQKQSQQWTKDNGQFIPYPATWLNGCRWEDEPEQTAPAHAFVTREEHIPDPY